MATAGGYGLVGLAAGTMGWIFGGETGWGMVGANDVAVRFAVGGTVAGFVVGTWLGTVDGVLQWLALRRYVSGWFVAASTVGEAVGAATSFTLAAAVGVAAGDILGAAGVFVVGGATAGAIVGGFLILLFARTNRPDSAVPDSARRVLPFKSIIGLLADRLRLPRLAGSPEAPLGARSASSIVG